MLTMPRATSPTTSSRPAWLLVATLVACYFAEGYCASSLTAIIAGAQPPPPTNYTYLIAVRIRRRFGFTLGCHDSLHSRAGYEFVRLESSVCSMLRRATAASGTAAAGPDAARQPWLTVQSCRADRFLCDQGLPLAQVALTLQAGGGPSPVGMTDLRLRFHSAANADEREMLIDQLHVMDYNECGSDDLNDCSLNAVCQNRPGTYACQCRAGYADLSPSDGPSGKVCVPLCGQSYCANGGECLSAGVCRCRAGYHGSKCDLSIEDYAEALKVGDSSRATLAMAFGSLALTLAAALFLVLWYRSRGSSRWRSSFHVPRNSSDECTGVCTGVAPTAVATVQHYHRLLAAKGSEA